MVTTGGHETPADEALEDLEDHHGLVRRAPHPAGVRTPAAVLLPCCCTARSTPCCREPSWWKADLTRVRGSLVVICVLSWAGSPRLEWPVVWVHCTRIGGGGQRVCDPAEGETRTRRSVHLGRRKCFYQGERVDRSDWCTGLHLSTLGAREGSSLQLKRSREHVVVDGCVRGDVV